MSRRRRFWSFACVGVVVLVGASPHLADVWVAAKYEPQIPFDRAAWEAGQEPNVIGGMDSAPRQRMIRDLVTNALPGKSRRQIESLLGTSPSREEMRRYSHADLEVREKDEHGNWKPFPRTGVGHYFDENEWDLIYPIGREQILVFDHKGQEFSPDTEYLIIRVDDDERFESWYVEGSTRWKRIVGATASRNFHRTRKRIGE